MHKLIDYICDELDALSEKCAKDGKLSIAEVQYMDTLAHAKKNLLKSEEMGGGSYARRRANQYGSYSDNMYSRESSDMVHKLHNLMEGTTDNQIKHDINRLIDKIEGRM